MTKEQEGKLYYIKNIAGKPVTEQRIIDSFIAGYNMRDREVKQEDFKHVVEDGDILVDLKKFSIVYKGTQKTLPKKLTYIIHYLISNKPRVISRQELLDQIWGEDVYVGERTVDVHIRKIKIALNDDCISSVKGVGYKWN